MNRHSVPDIDDLPALIRTAFDALPGPDEERLAAVGERLAQQPGTQKKTLRKGRHSWYWLWLLLAGGAAATAAWWAGDMFRDEVVGEPYEQQKSKQRLQQASPDMLEFDEDVPDEESAGDVGERSPIIYKRETH